MKWVCESHAGWEVWFKPLDATPEYSFMIEVLIVASRCIAAGHRRLLYRPEEA